MVSFSLPMGLLNAFANGIFTQDDMVSSSLAIGLVNVFANSISRSA